MKRGPCAVRTTKKEVARSGEMRISVSRRTICGSCSPARANSASMAGMVADTSIV
jgi:hypothetical protein